MSHMPPPPPFNGKDAADNFREGENAFGDQKVNTAASQMAEVMHEKAAADRARAMEEVYKGENSSATNFLRYRIKNGKAVRYNISDHQPFIKLKVQDPYDAGYLQLNFIQGRKTGRYQTAADNIKLPKGFPLDEAIKYTDQVYVDSLQEGEQAYQDYQAFLARHGELAKQGIKKAKLLQGRLKCRFRSLFEFQDELSSALGDNHAEAGKIQGAINDWALQGADHSSDIFKKNAHQGVQDAILKAIDAVSDEEKKGKLREKFADVLTSIEEEMDNRRKGRKLDTAALFQDISCNPSAVVFKNGQAFMVKDGDNFHMIGGREEDWEQLILAALKYINDKDPWSARPVFTGSPEFVTFAISVARKYTIRWAITDQSLGTGYEENFFQYGDQLQAIQQGSPQHHDQGFWVETVFVYQKMKDGTVQQLYEDSPTGEKIPKTMSIQCWDPEVANPTMKDIDWTHVRNFACRRPPYDSGVVRKGYMDSHKRARQGVIMPFREDADGVTRIDSDNLNEATLKIMSFEDLKRSNEAAFPNTVVNSVSDLLSAYNPYGGQSQNAGAQEFNPLMALNQIHDMIGEYVPEEVGGKLISDFSNYFQQGRSAPTADQMFEMLDDLPVAPAAKKMFRNIVIAANQAHMNKRAGGAAAPGMEFAVA